MARHTEVFADFIKPVLLRDHERILLPVDLTLSEGLVEPVKAHDPRFRAECLVELDKQFAARRAHAETFEIGGCADRLRYGGDVLEAVFHAAERDEIDSGSRESITHKVAELPVREGCHLFAGRKREGYALDVGPWMRLAQN